MHYIIDGYNLLFQTTHLEKGKNFSDSRMRLISELDAIAKTLSLHVTIIFDAPFQETDEVRCHYYCLEIIYTNHRQNADDYMAEWVHSLPKNKKITAVTSDKRLKMRLIAPNVTIIAVREFLQKMRKRILKKKKEPVTLRKRTEKKAKEKKEEIQVAEIDYNKLPPLSDIDAWEAIFTRKKVD